MSRVCQLTGARPKAGNNVSHSKRRTKRVFLPNLITKRIFNEKHGIFVKVRMSARALRTLTKNPKKFQDKITLLAKKQVKKDLNRKQK